MIRFYDRDLRAPLRLGLPQALGERAAQHGAERFRFVGGRAAEVLDRLGILLDQPARLLDLLHTYFSAAQQVLHRQAFLRHRTAAAYADAEARARAVSIERE